MLLLLLLLLWLSTQRRTRQSRPSKLRRTRLGSHQPSRQRKHLVHSGSVLAHGQRQPKQASTPTGRTQRARRSRTRSSHLRCVSARCPAKQSQRSRWFCATRSLGEKLGPSHRQRRGQHSARLRRCCTSQLVTAHLNHPLAHLQRLH